MALQKFEKDFREKLAGREIMPSQKSWGNLQDRLESQEEKKIHRFWWVGIAACIAGAAFMLNLFSFAPEQSGIQQVVEMPVKEEEAEEVPGVREIPVIEKTIVTFEKKPIIKEPSRTEPLHSVRQEGLGDREPRKAISAVAVQEKTGVLQENADIKQTALKEEIISAKLEEVLVSLEESSGGVTDTEVEELLQKAAAEIGSEFIAQKSTARVDHKSLLWEVEMELERSFRDKVLELLKEGYLRTRTAVANRNL